MGGRSYGVDEGRAEVDDDVRCAVGVSGERVSGEEGVVWSSKHGRVRTVVECPLDGGSVPRGHNCTLATEFAGGHLKLLRSVKDSASSSRTYDNEMNGGVRALSDPLNRYIT